MAVIESNGSGRKPELIRQLIKVSGIEHRLEASIRDQYGNAPGGQTVIKNAKAKIPELIVAIAERYNKFFTESQLKAWVELYEALGEDFVDAQMKLEAEMTQLIAAWAVTAVRDSIKGMF